MGHAQWIFMIEDKESQGTDRENIRALHQNQHTYSRKSNQRISVLVIEVNFKPQNIAKVPSSDSNTAQTRSIDHIYATDL